MVAAAYLNPSFEDAAGDQVSMETGVAEPFNLVDLDSLEVQTQDGVTTTYVFEIGTRGETTAGNAETYGLTDGQTLDVEIDGAPAVTATFLLADFVDIANATASEVAGVLQAALGTDAAVDVVAGAVRIRSTSKGSSSTVNVSGGTAAGVFSFPAGTPGVDYFVDITAATAAEVADQIIAQSMAAGVDIFAAPLGGGTVDLFLPSANADKSLEIVGGSAVPKFQFPEGPVFGVEDPGEAFFWTVTTVSSVWDFAEFNGAHQFPGSFETFALGWLGNEDDLFALTDADLNFAVFDVNLQHEPFDWFGFANVLPATEAAVFNGATDFEPFSEGWLSNENDIFAYVGGELTSALFDTTLEDVEDFDEQWSGNENDSSTLGPLTQLTFGQGGDAETFAPFTDVFSEYEVQNAIPGETVVIEVNGIPCPYVVQLGDTEADIAVELAACIDNLPEEVSAVAVGDRVQITNLSTSAEPFNTSSGGTTPSNCVEVFDVIDPDAGWTGKTANFCI